MTSFCRSVASLAIVAAMVLFAMPARAQSAAAQALFEEGRRLMNDGDYARACPKLKESYAIDPALGALLNLATCYERAGKTASAWAAFKDAVGLATTADDSARADLARRHIEALEPRLTRLQITLAPDAEVAGLRVTHDGTELSLASVGTPLPVDPGRSEIVAEAPGRRRWSTTVEATEDAKTYEIVIPMLAERGPPSSPSPPVAPFAEPDRAAPAPAASRSGGVTGLELAGWVVGGVGVASGIVGGVFGGLAIAKGQDIADRCTLGPDANQCPSTDLTDDNDTARTQATVSTVMLIGGGALVAGGLLMVLLAPDAGEEPASGVRIRPTAQGVSLTF